MSNKTYYVLVDVDGIMIGIDRASGGYPWQAGKYGLMGVEFWTDQGAAQKYADTCKGYEVKVFNYTLSDPIK